MKLDTLIDKNKECIICFELIDNDIQNIIYPSKTIEIFKDCNHNNIYHSKCANEWINTCIDNNITPACPLCRNQLKLKEVVIHIPDEVITNIQIPNIRITNIQYNYDYEYENISRKFACCLFTTSILLIIIIIPNMYMTY